MEIKQGKNLSRQEEIELNEYLASGGIGTSASQVNKERVTPIKQQRSKLNNGANAENVKPNMQNKAMQQKRQTTKNTENKPEGQKLSKVATKSNNKEKLKITFIGGVGEIGKNMPAFEYKDEIIVVDAGLTFPDGDLPGVDIVVPDIS